MTPTVMTDTVTMVTNTFVECGAHSQPAMHAHADANGVLSLDSQKVIAYTTRELKRVCTHAMCGGMQIIPKWKVVDAATVTTR
jgi:hypothetical protein